MPLEVRQMVVRSSVVPDRAPADRDGDPRLREEALKREILREVRARLRALRDDPKER